MNNLYSDSATMKGLLPRTFFRTNVFLVIFTFFSNTLLSSACTCGCALTVDLQHFGGLLRCLCESHMVHSAGVGHSIIISVHMQLQRAPHCKRLPTCVHLFGPFKESCMLSVSNGAHLSFRAQWQHTSN